MNMNKNLYKFIAVIIIMALVVQQNCLAAACRKEAGLNYFKGDLLNTIEESGINCFIDKLDRCVFEPLNTRLNIFESNQASGNINWVIAAFKKEEIDESLFLRYNKALISSLLSKDNFFVDDKKVEVMFSHEKKVVYQSVNGAKKKFLLNFFDAYKAGDVSIMRKRIEDISDDHFDQLIVYEVLEWLDKSNKLGKKGLFGFKLQEKR